MLPATIATSVAPETIAKVGRLFNGSAHDVLSELLQNARRAGATAIVISTSGSPGDRLLHVVDDGSGIADPAAVVTLGRSGWSEETRVREDPAGMGVFSLACRDVIIRSWSQPERQGWMAHIPAGAWESSRPIAISADPIDRGTAITVRMPEDWSEKLGETVRDVARHYPVPVTFDGEVITQTDWLADAVRVEAWNGCRIGVFHEESAQDTFNRPRLNFHGVTIRCPIDSIGEVGRSKVWTARVDIIDCPAIQLVLPARKEAVQNPALDALRVAVRAAIFRTIAAQPSHRLAFATWSEAKALGIEMPEAEPYLFAWTPPTADYHSSYESGERTADPAMVLMPDFEALVAQPAQAAIRAHNAFGGPLVEAQDAFRGYGWYDVLALVEDLRFRVTQGDRTFIVSDAREAPAEADDGWVDTITLEATMSHAGASIEVACDADVAFAPDQWSCNSVEETSIFVRRGTAMTAHGVADLLEAAIFHADEDSDADSYDTQHERFRSDAAGRIIAMMEGDDAALENRIRDLLADHYYLVPKDRTVTVILNRDRLVEVTISERPVVPAEAEAEGA